MDSILWISTNISSAHSTLLKSRQDIYSEKDTKFSKIFTLLLSYVVPVRGISILGEVRNVEISRVTQQLQCSKSHDFLDIFALAHSKINQIA